MAALLYSHGIIRFQFEYHPDRYATESADAQEEAAERATQINDAYQLLMQPHKRYPIFCRIMELNEFCLMLRALHLLELVNAPLEEENAAGLIAPAFLVEVCQLGM